MKRLIETIIVAAGLLWSAAAGFAQAEKQPPPPMPPTNASPVDLFRALMTNAAAREQLLASKSPQARKIIEAKLREYEGMMVEQREARLRGLKLRWLTLQLMKLEPEERAKRLAALPELDRATVEKRLG